MALANPAAFARPKSGVATPFCPRTPKSQSFQANLAAVRILSCTRRENEVIFTFAGRWIFMQFPTA
jgi:hypothetical protein